MAGITSEGTGGDVGITVEGDGGEPGGTAIVSWSGPRADGKGDIELEAGG
jgi:hypothetical protein